MDRALIADVDAMQRDVAELMEKQAFHLVLERINVVVRHGNRYVEDNAPWALAKNGDTARLNTVLYHLVETLRLVAVQLSPFMPEKMNQMLSKICSEDMGGKPLTFIEHGGWGLLKAGHQCANPQPVFPRMDV